MDSPQTPAFTKSPLFLIAPFFFLGTSMVAMKAVIPNTSPLFLAGFRLVPAGIIILGLTLVLKLPQPKTLKAWLWILMFAIVDGLMFQGFLTEGLVNTGAGLGAVLIDAQPLVVAILSRLLFGEFIGIWGWLGLAIGVLGISLCGLPEQWIVRILHTDLTIFQGASSISWFSLIHSGEFLMLLAALSMSFGTIIIRYVRQHADAIVATGWHMVLGGVPLFILSIFFETQQVSNLDSSSWVGLGYATLFGTALTYGIFFYLASVGNLTSVSALIFLTPIFAMLFSYIFLGEMLTTFQWIGVVLTLVSVVMVIQREAIAKNLIPSLIDKLKPAAIPVLENTSEPPSN
ncbi:putative membrane protein [Synechococcus sp. PCC 7502]|uniref:DMT family transporter n=1 Tax=Synechococcus sp. PCC 7502 TaxID=1173263 RepID=UPI00029F80A9|nr:DMT family transporter [Synechococcus sp. PCC 7502]AFY72422.1 putative membrane protein [Synechococcus sp. PCC 7502]